MLFRKNKQKDIFIENSYFYIIGKYLGFPECCIKSFILNFSEGLGQPIKAKKLFGTGYIPCENCNNRYSEGELIDRINKNRLYHLPFPKSENIYSEINMELFNLNSFNEHEKKIYLHYIENYT